MNDRHRPADVSVALEGKDGFISPNIYLWWCFGGFLPRRARRVSPALWLHNAYPAIELKGHSLRLSAILCDSEPVPPIGAKSRKESQRISKNREESQRVAQLASVVILTNPVRSRTLDRGSGTARPEARP